MVDFFNWDVVNQQGSKETTTISQGLIIHQFTCLVLEENANITFVLPSSWNCGKAYDLLVDGVWLGRRGLDGGELSSGLILNESGRFFDIDFLYCKMSYFMMWHYDALDFIVLPKYVCILKIFQYEPLRARSSNYIHLD